MKNEIDIRIAHIRELDSLNRLSRWEMLRYRPGTPVDVSLRSRFVAHPGSDCLSMILGVRYTTVRGLVRRPMLEFSIEVVFEIPDIGSVVTVDGARVSVPSRLLVIMLSTSVGTLRGMLAAKTRDTFLAAWPLPVINVSHIVSRLAYGDVVDSARPIVNFVYE